MSTSDSRQLHNRLQIDELCTNFEKYVQKAAPELRDDLLAELIAIEFEYAEQCDLQLDESIYYERFPQRREVIDLGLARSNADHLGMIFSSDGRPIATNGQHRQLTICEAEPAKE